MLGYPGKFFEDFAKGEKILHRLGRTVTYQDNLYFTHAMMNTAPIHFDKEYMELTEFGKPLLVMTMTLAMVYGITSEVFKNVYREVEIRDLRFTAPVFDGDTLHVETEVLETREIPGRDDVGSVIVRHRVYKNWFSQTVCEFVREVLVYKRNYSPIWRIAGQGSMSNPGSPR
ncbi:MAG: MaoC family dehydratase [Desulfurococcales archaeon]|nr:MaoC family dehydratase [Desulfurococcales archaeon]